MLPYVIIAAVTGFCLFIASRYTFTGNADLAKIPKAHFSVAFTRLWQLWIRWKECENRTLLELHARFGPVIRVAPQQVNVNCVDGGVRLIFSSEFDKTRWYPGAFFGLETPYMFTMLRKEDHTARKKLMQAMFTKSHVMNSHAIENCMTKVSDRLKRQIAHWAGSDDRVDVLQWNRATMMDITTPWLYGEQNGTDFLRDTTERDRFLSSWHSCGAGHFWRSEFFWWTQVLHKLGIDLVPQTAQRALKEVQDWGAMMTARASSAYSDSSDPAANLYQHFRTNAERTSSKDVANDRVASAELLDDAIASHDVGGITLSYIMYELSRVPECQDALRAELRSLAESSDGKSAQQIDRLVLLDAIITETLRLHTPSPGPNFRVVPGTGCRINGRYDLAPDTIVSATAYTLHRNPIVFESPNAWKPERWLVDDEVKLREMRSWFSGFGTGSRACIGIHFAMRALKSILSTVYKDHETVLCDDNVVTQADISIAAAPIGNTLYLKFRRRT